MPMEPDPNIVTSGFSGRVTRDGITVDVVIIRLEDSPEWTLEVVNRNGTSIVWDEPFLSDKAAHDEFLRTVATEGMKAFIDKPNVVPFKRP